MNVLGGANLVAVVVVAALFAGGVYLLLERSLSRVLIGVILLSNGVNLLFLFTGSPGGGAPIVGVTPEGEMSDPLPQAMVLTAIVITLGMVGFLLAMAYRSWQLNEHDEVQDDLEDRRIARMAAIDQATTSDLDVSFSTVVTLDEEAAEARDETAQFVEEYLLAEEDDED
ncbi:MAG: Na(+)/H(+) antiporter subunit C [Acidimicrobiia bacterium]